MIKVNPITAYVANAETTTRKSNGHETPSISEAASQATKRRQPDYDSSHSPPKRTRRLADHPSVQSESLEETPGIASGRRVRTVEAKTPAHMAYDGGGEDDLTASIDHGTAALDLVSEGCQRRGIDLSPVMAGADRHTESTRLDQIDHDTSPFIDEDETISGNNISLNQRRWQVHERGSEATDLLRSAALEDAESGTNNAQRTKYRGPGREQNALAHVDPKSWIRRQIYPVLEIFSHQILCSLAGIPLDEGNVMFYPNSSLASREAWGAINSLFNQAKSLLSHTSGFLDNPDPVEDEKSNEQLLWQVNLTTSLCLLFASERGYDDMTELHSRFPKLFCKSETELHEWQIALLLDIKKEVWITGVRENKFSKTEGLRHMFLLDFGNPMTKQLQLQCSKILPSLQELPVQTHGRQLNFEQHYGPQLKHLVRNFLGFAGPQSPQLLLDANLNKDRDGTAPTDGTTEILDINKQVESLQKSVEEVIERKQSAEFEDDCYQENENMMNSTHASVVVDTEHRVPRDESTPSRASVKILDLSEFPADVESRKFNLTAGDNSTLRQHGMGHNDPSSTQELYEKAKLAASAKAAARNKGIPLLPSQRRPWSSEEENALMTGLDRVQGPHWSQILAMYGSDGSISEILKDRNQVQLKDKARNLKLFFLKSGHDVPHYLKNVTGELKTRAPTQVLRTDLNNLQALSSSSSPRESLEIAKPRANEFEPDDKLPSQSAGLISESRGGAGDHDISYDDHHSHHQEDEEDLSNAIQLALQAIQGKTSEPQSGERDEEKLTAKPDRKSIHTQLKWGKQGERGRLGSDSAIVAGR